jgi:hypothetical protein
VINDVKSFLSQHFDMKYLGESDVIHNVKLIKDESGITLKKIPLCGEHSESFWVLGL